jgi:hypothetical protein
MRSERIEPTSKESLWIVRDPVALEVDILCRTPSRLLIRKEKEASLEDELSGVRRSRDPCQEPFLHVENACILEGDTAFFRLQREPGTNGRFDILHTRISSAWRTGPEIRSCWE